MALVGTQGPKEALLSTLVLQIRMRERVKLESNFSFGRSHGSARVTPQKPGVPRFKQGQAGDPPLGETPWSLEPDVELLHVAVLVDSSQKGFDFGSPLIVERNWILGDPFELGG